MKGSSALALFATLVAATGIAARPAVAAADESPTFETGGMTSSTFANGSVSEPRLRTDDIPFGSQREWSMDLGRGFSVTSYSSGVSLGPTGSFLTDLRSPVSPQTGAYGRANNSFTDYGTRISMDVGSGVSFNVIGGLSKFTAVGSFADPSLLPSMTSRIGTSAHIGGGFSLDLGGGSSVSLTGSVSSASGALGNCVGVPISLCR